MNEAWRQNRDELRDQWQRENPPGTRCFAEWLFELVPAYGERRVTEHWGPCAPFRQNWLTRGILHTNCIPPLQESQRAYLFRNGVIDRAEYDAAERLTDQAGGCVAGPGFPRAGTPAPPAY